MFEANIQKNQKTNYFEGHESPFDEFVFCDECKDYFYEYCYEHGPLLVIPDDKIPENISGPMSIPQAALTIPRDFLHIASSIIPDAGLGVFSTLTLPKGVRFGPYKGVIRGNRTASLYEWQIFGKNGKPSHTVDASDGHSSNWMRYVNCARHWHEQNLVAFQYQGELYYRTIKIIARNTELLVFYGCEFAYLLGIDLVAYNSNILSVKGDDTKSLNILEKYNETKSDIQIKHKEETSTGFNSNNIVTVIPKRELINTTIEDYNEIEVDNVIKHTTEVKHVDINCCRENNKVYYNRIVKDATLANKNICNVCEKGFMKRKYLIQHLSIHNKEKCFKCNRCDYKTHVNSYMRRHITNVHYKKCKKPN